MLLNSNGILSSLNQDLSLHYMPWTLFLAVATLLSACTVDSLATNESSGEPWVLIDDFENRDALDSWILNDTRNDTQPRIENPQITLVETNNGNRYLLKKPAADGVVGNRKALSYKKLPVAIGVGEIYTIYTKINVEYFPNNHIFGLSDMLPSDIALHDYNALEPSLRVTDKSESDGTKNDGTLMVRVGKGYSKILNPDTNSPAKPLQPDTWYELWYVVNNSKRSDGGQRYDVYIRGGDEFPEQEKVFADADFRMQRERPLIYFLTNCNTGPANHPYGNGGLRYDDIYMVKGPLLSAPH